MGRVIVVGSVNVDLVVRGERLPTPGETVVGGTFQRFHGGKGGNQAVAAARLGADVAFVGAVGEDDFGTSATEALDAEGVDTASVERVAGSATGVALIVVDAAGENLISVASGANGELTPGHIDTAFARLRPSSGDLVLVGHEIPTSTMHAALGHARHAGAKTILNPAPVGDLDAASVAGAGLLTPNAGELRRLAGTDDPTAAATALLAQPGIDAVLVSVGREGAVLHRPAATPLRIAAPLVEAIDATGAGDTLNGALAAGIAAGVEVEAAARRAVLAASLSVTRVGAREGMPTPGDLDAFAHRIVTGTG